VAAHSLTRPAPRRRHTAGGPTPINLAKYAGETVMMIGVSVGVCVSGFFALSLLAVPNREPRTDALSFCVFFEFRTRRHIRMTLRTASEAQWRCSPSKVRHALGLAQEPVEGFSSQPPMPGSQARSKRSGLMSLALCRHQGRVCHHHKWQHRLEQGLQHDQRAAGGHSVPGAVGCRGRSQRVRRVHAELSGECCVCSDVCREDVLLAAAGLAVVCLCACS
jgi:hypothetical protein